MDPKERWETDLSDALTQLKEEINMRLEPVLVPVIMWINRRVHNFNMWLGRFKLKYITIRRMK